MHHKRLLALCLIILDVLAVILILQIDITTPNRVQNDASVPTPEYISTPAMVWLDTHNRDVMSAEFSPYGKYVVASTMEGTVTMWNSYSGVKARDFIGHKGDVHRVAFTKNGKFLISGSRATGFSVPNDDNTIRVWNVETGKEIAHISNPTLFPNTLDVSPDKNYVIAHGYLNNVDTIFLLDFPSGEQIKAFTGYQQVIWDIAFSHNGQDIVTGGGYNIAEVKNVYDYTVRIWDVNTGMEIQDFVGHMGMVRTVAFSPDDRYLLTAGDDNKVILWNVGTGRIVREFLGHTGYVTSARFSPDGQYILTGSWDQTIRIWDVNTGKELQKITGDWTNVVGFSPDGKRFLAGGGDGIVRIWNFNPP